MADKGVPGFAGFHLGHEDGYGGESWSGDDGIELAIQQKFLFHNEGYSRTAGAQYHASHCVHCGTIQGDWVVEKLVMEMEVEGRQVSSSVEKEVPGASTEVLG